jgi:hypothetical protein
MQTIRLVVLGVLLTLLAGCGREGGPVTPAVVSDEIAAEQKNAENSVLEEEREHGKHPYRSAFPELESQQRAAEKKAFDEELEHVKQTRGNRR